ncbi:kinase-like domain-containing protein [Gigaspora rosea]|uniref:Kinase-like domain-containing protein n=1 Tax=Gigaspora rosea TaxID=44941 RepID=A0A397W883_9GLOM|nr:kinase-like domain-containing protein [Gigaspora rosea]
MQLNKKHIVYGITQNTVTDKYMMVFEFYYERNIQNGKCENCNRYNTSPAWCQTCDPQKIAQGWTSGNKQIDDYIKEFQFKTTKYEDIIEWIPFNKLNNIRIINKDAFSSTFVATWLDGIRIISDEFAEYTQTRTPSYTVDLKTLPSSKNLLDFLNEFKGYTHLKNNECKVYGITQSTITNEYMVVFDEFYSTRNHRNGKCGNCNRYNTSRLLCQTCDLLTCGNKDIDDFIKEYEDVIEWMPFHRLDNIQVIGKGRFGTVYSAQWLESKRNSLTQRAYRMVALKTLSGSQENFLKDFKNYMKLRSVYRGLKVYGITRNADNEYLMVFQYANMGNLRNYLELNFKELKWKSKLKLLIDITKSLTQIHQEENVHGDFHSGNVLLQNLNRNVMLYIADLGLSRMNDSEGFYGVLPYVAPEVLNKQPYTTTADIYSFGVIMAEISTGKPPYYDIDYDEKLAIRICNGLRPEFAKGTPEFYIQLANQCMDVNPSSRPTASDIHTKLTIWYNVISNYAEMFKDGLVIKEAFASADLTIPTLLTTIPNYSQDKLTSKLLNFQDLPSPLNPLVISPTQSSEVYDSVSQNFFISDKIDYYDNYDN